MQYLNFVLLLALLYLVVRGQSMESPKPITAARRKVILDSCALIDGRILDLSKSGFVPDEIIIPEFILHELQLLADGSDPHKRERARFGLDVVKDLQASAGVKVVIDTTPVPGQHAADDKLVTLASQKRAMLYTTDYNLSKIAEIKGVRVLNVNELAQQLRPTALPGERKQVKILQKGSNRQQGVGYIEDGTMVVVDGAAGHIGETVDVSITKSHQTVAGKMLFADMTTMRRRTNPKQTALIAKGPRLLRQRLKRPRV